jgi:predicted DNA-binding protein with PD1-like motif
MTKSVVGAFGELIFARFDPKEDLIGSIKQLCKERNIRTGVILSLTGGVSEAQVSSFKEPARTTDRVTQLSEEQRRHTLQKVGVSTEHLKGPLSVTGTGVIGMEADDEPYIHIHLVLTSAEGTTCGHVWEGTPVQSLAPFSHFTMVIARVVGAELRDLAADQGQFKGIPYHEIVEVPVA